MILWVAVYFAAGVDTCHVILVDLAGPLWLDGPPPSWFALLRAPL